MKKGTKTLVILMLVVGVSLLLYPRISNMIAEFKQHRIINNYLDTLQEISDDRYEKIYDEAMAYNEELYSLQKKGLLKRGLDNYNRILKIDNMNVLGYIEIPRISVRIPIYHGTEEAVLQVGVGHSSYTSVPIGGESTHAMLFGHSALPHAKLFTDLEMLQVDDSFYIGVLNQKLEYKITNIEIIEPKDLSHHLFIEEGRDLVTLVTCTPYGVNSHRLIVTGERFINTVDDPYANIDSPSRDNNVSSFILGVLCSATVVEVILIIAIEARRKRNARIKF